MYSRVLLVHQGSQDHLVSQEPICHHLTLLKVLLLVMLGHLVFLAKMGYQANLGFQ